MSITQTIRTPVQVRSQLIDALQIDLVGPNSTVGAASEVLQQAPSRWYLTGFLVPQDAEVEQRADEDSAEEVAEVSDASGLDDSAPPEPAAAKKKYLPSSIGLSFLVAKGCKRLEVNIGWGEYRAGEKERDGKTFRDWQRSPRSETVPIDLPNETQQVTEIDVPNSAGLKV